VREAARFSNALRRGVVELRAEYHTDGVAHCQHAADTPCGGTGNLRCLEYVAPADRGDVVTGLFLQSALPGPVGLVYPEVARRRRGRLRSDVADLDFPDFVVPDGGR